MDEHLESDGADDAREESRVFVALLAELIAAIEAGRDAEAERILAVQPAYRDALRNALRVLGNNALLERPAAQGMPALSDFELLEQLSDSGMGVVYRARQRSLPREVAVKFIRPDLLDSADVRARFEREMRVVAQLQHPSIVPIHAFGEERGRAYFAMPFVDGCTLEAALAALAEHDPARLRGDDLARVVCAKARHADATRDETSAYLFEGTWESTALRIVRSLADALAHVHERGILHRDVKASNVMLTPAGRALLFDFGLARERAAEPYTGSLVQLGSLYYLPPEQLATGAKHVDERSDVYSLGVVLYQLLTLRVPYRGATVPDTYQRIGSGHCARPRELNAKLSWEAETVCLTAIERDPALRYASARDFAHDLSNALERRPIRAKPLALPRRVQRWAMRRPALAVALVSGAIGLLVVPSLFAYKSGAVHAAERTAEFHRDVSLLSRLEAQVDELWPVTPTTIVRVRDWKDAALALVRRTAANRDAWMRTIGDPAQQVADAADQLAYYERVAELQAKDPYAHTMASIDARLDLFDGLVQSAQDSRESWERASASIADERACPLYRGLRIEPQFGLVPLERDAHSGLWEFWVVASGERPRRGASGAWSIDDATGMVLVLLPDAHFQMGSQSEHPDAPNYDEHAETHEKRSAVAQLDAFFISKYEMTQRQWQRVMGKNPSYYPPETYGAYGVRGSCPVEQVSHVDCTIALRRLGLALPTEAQWEYAARAGTTTPWYTGTIAGSLRDHANIGDMKNTGVHGYPYDPEPGFEDPFAVHGPVGTFAPNAFGLHDVHGNVGEWCRDHHGSYPDVAPRIGDGLRDGNADAPLIYRGGSFQERAVAARSAFRRWEPEHDTSATRGVRPMRVIERSDDRK